MEKAKKWLRHLLTGKKEKGQGMLLQRKKYLLRPSPATPPTTPKGLSRRSFHFQVGKITLKQEQIAAIKIQSFFRSCLARKALRALKGLVKLQAVVRGFMVRKKAAATLRSMQALLAVQVRARAQRVQMIEEARAVKIREDDQRRKINEFKFQPLSFDQESNVEKATAMDFGQSKANQKNKKINQFTQNEDKDQRFDEPVFTSSRSSSQHSSPTTKPCKFRSPDTYSSIQDIMPQDSSLFPNYMANTQSWKSKLRSQSVPRRRNDLLELKQPGKLRGSVDGRSLSRASWTSPRSSGAVRDKFLWSGELDTVLNRGYH